MQRAKKKEGQDTSDEEYGKRTYFPGFQDLLIHSE